MDETVTYVTTNVYGTYFNNIHASIHTIHAECYITHMKPIIKFCLSKFHVYFIHQTSPHQICIIACCAKYNPFKI